MTTIVNGVEIEHSQPIIISPEGVVEIGVNPDVWEPHPAQAMPHWAWKASTLSIQTKTD